MNQFATFGIFLSSMFAGASVVHYIFKPDTVGREQEVFFSPFLRKIFSFAPFFEQGRFLARTLHSDGLMELALSFFPCFPAGIEVDMRALPLQRIRLDDSSSQQDQQPATKQA